MSEALTSPASFVRHAAPFPPLDAPLRAGWGSFDDLRLVRPGRVVLFDVAPPAAPAAARFLADLADAAGGGAVVVEAPGVEAFPAPVLARVARPATRGGLLSLLEGPLPDLLASEPVRVVVVTGLPEACVGVRRRGAPEGRTWLAYALGRLREAARAHGVAVVVATSVLSGRPSHALRDLLLEAADEAVALLPGPGGGLRFQVPGRGVAVQAAGPARPGSPVAASA